MEDVLSYGQMKIQDSSEGRKIKSNFIMHFHNLTLYIYTPDWGPHISFLTATCIMCSSSLLYNELHVGGADCTAAAAPWYNGAPELGSSQLPDTALRKIC